MVQLLSTQCLRNKKQSFFFFVFFSLKPVEVEQPVYYDRRWNSTFFFLFKIIYFFFGWQSKEDVYMGYVCLDKHQAWDCFVNNYWYFFIVENSITEEKSEFSILLGYKQLEKELKSSLQAWVWVMASTVSCCIFKDKGGWGEDDGGDKILLQLTLNR